MDYRDVVAVEVVGGVVIDPIQVEVVIVVRRIMMEGNKPVDFGKFSECKGLLQRAVTPTNVIWIFGTAVLGIVDKEVNTGGDCIA